MSAGRILEGVSQQRTGADDLSGVRSAKTSAVNEFLTGKSIQDIVYRPEFHVA